MNRTIKETEITQYIRKYPHYFSEEFEEYDFMAMANVLVACIDNLIKYAIPIEIENFGNNLLLNKDEVAFIKKLADNLKELKYDG